MSRVGKLQMQLLHGASVPNEARSSQLLRTLRRPPLALLAHPTAPKTTSSAMHECTSSCNSLPSIASSGPSLWPRCPSTPNSSVGVLLVIGLLTRWAGLLMTFNFIVAVVMVHWSQDFRGWWPAIVLVFISLHFALHGAGRYSVDQWLWARRTDRAIAGALIAFGR